MEFDIKSLEIKDENDIESLSRFLSFVFPKATKFNAAFIKWQYTSCPDGHMIGFNAYDKDKIVSHFAALPLRLSVYGKEYRGAACVNVSTDPNYRGKMLFTKLGLATIEFAKNNGFDFLIAVPNANSTHAFMKYFDFQMICPLTVKIGFGKPNYETPLDIYKIWNEDLMKWRLNNPTNNYGINDTFIFSPISFFAKTINKLPLKLENTDLQNFGFRPLNLYIGTGAKFHNRMYFPIPKLIKRPPFNLVFKDLTGNLSSIKKEDFFLQLLDLDTI